MSESSRWLVWCDLNDESKRLHELIQDSVEVKGADKASHKADAVTEFADGSIRALVSKPSITGYGCN